MPVVRTIKEDIVRLQRFLFLLVSFSLLAFVAACAGAPTPEVIVEKVVETVVVEKEVEG